MKQKTKLYNLLLISCLIIFSYSCDPIEDKNQFKTTEYKIDIPKYFPNKLNLPTDNPLTEEGIKLGRYLFYDKRFRGYSGNNADSMMCCASCHIQANAFTCGIEHPKYTDGLTFGVTGKYTNHVVMPLYNLVFNNNGYLWNGMIYPDNPNIQYRNLEDIVRMTIIADDEMCSSPERCIATLENISIYPPMFKAAFGSEEITLDRICKAIAQFIRTLISSDSKFDKYLRGETQLTDDELAGYVLFVTEEGADCFHCHGSDGNLLMTTNSFYNNGLDSLFNDSQDRASVTRTPNDIGAYRAPSLRNISFTAPYMHDGRFKTLDEVIDFYSEGLKNTPYVHSLMHQINNGGVMLTQKEKRQLKAFLLTLNDSLFINNSKYSKPQELP